MKYHLIIPISAIIYELWNADLFNEMIGTTEEEMNELIDKAVECRGYHPLLSISSA